jgi:LEA14-like dessication related protein
MNKQFCFSILVVMACCMAFSSCKIYAPVFKSIDNLRYERIDTRGFKLGAEAVFENPNKVKCTIKDIEINVVLDKKLIGVLGEKTDVQVIKASEFRVPLGIKINPDGTILDDIKTLWNIFADKESDLYFVGKIKVKILGITVPIPIKYQRKFKLSEFRKKP